MKKWSSQVQFPTDSNFVNRITDFTFGPSNNSGNPMITLNMEVVSPSEVEVGGDMVNIAGVKTTNYFVTQSNDDEEKTANYRKYLTDPENGLFAKLQLPLENIPWDNLTPYLEPIRGKLILTQMSSEIEEKTKNPTSAQIEAGKKQGLKVHQIKGDVMKHPMSGAKLINYWPKVREIFGLAPNQDGVQVPY